MLEMLKIEIYYDIVERAMELACGLAALSRMYHGIPRIEPLLLCIPVLERALYSPRQ